MTDTSLIYEKDYENKRACLTFNRPEAMNAITPEMSAAINEAMEDFNNDPDLWVAIITGAGDRAFCAGADLGSTIPNQTASARTRPLAVSERRPFDQIYEPILAGVNGYCLAGGLELLQGTDIRVASETAAFGLQEVRWGLVPSAGSHIRLPRQIPWAWAMEILLTGHRITAQQALQCGLVNRVVPPDQVMPTVHDFADKICANGPIAVRTAKEIAVRGAMGMSWEHAFALESLLSTRVLAAKTPSKAPRPSWRSARRTFRGARWPWPAGSRGHGHWIVRCAGTPTSRRAPPAVTPASAFARGRPGRPSRGSSAPASPRTPAAIP